MFAKSLIAAFIRILFALLSLLPQKRTIAFLSRQSAEPFDFKLLAPELRKRFPNHNLEWACVTKSGELGVSLFLRQLYLVATAQVCLVDGYVPAVSIPSHHRCACIQVWHASGAIKKFGYQCLDTPSGRTSVDAQAFHMHEGYDYIIAGMQGAVPAFAEAFKTEPSCILPIGLPSLDYLLGQEYELDRKKDADDARAQIGLADGATKIVLYAPTFRRSAHDKMWLEAHTLALLDAFSGQDVVIVLAGHPLDEDSARQIAANGNSRLVVFPRHTIQALLVADLVVSDYSSVALDAAALGKPVLFYVPDIAEYRESPGLTIDPLLLFPEETFSSAQKLARTASKILEKEPFAQNTQDVEGDSEVILVSGSANGVTSQPIMSFMQDYAGNLERRCTPALLNLISGMINE